ncbi:hypothetical protein [Shewanella xiamenensis]|uniref:hypothetical protein n=1 Tax=Shewanella xiamenensis TaxID=332186 RepID=UPI00244C62CA|nr:hypothetical protein [Shewanella xiamenensis]MDH1627181.1 hypothetical protein [Shewanella xiamenensis]MDV5246298.1 hypothetical protein [Shewanella xiamenensis]
MKSHNVIFTLATTVLGTCFASQTVANENLPPCKEGFCQKITRDKEQDKATLQVWTEEGKVIYSYSFDLDRTAKLEHISRGNESLDINQAFYSPKQLPVDCAKEACSTTISVTYATETALDGVVTLFVYARGELLSVSAWTNTTQIPVELTNNNR